MAVERLVGTTNHAVHDRLFEFRAHVAARMNRMRYINFVDLGGPRRLPTSLEAKLFALAAEASRHGWDGERGLRVAPSAWCDARHILRQLPDSVLRSQALHVSMSGDGFVHLTVSRPERGSATVEAGHGKYYWTWMRGMDEPVTADLPSLTEAASKLAQFAAN